MNYSKLTITQRIEVASYAITNALNNPVIAAALAVFGYDATKLNDGETLLNNVKTLQAKQKQEYIEQRAATSDRDAIREEIDVIYEKHLKLARVAFKHEPNILLALEADGARLRAYDGWKAQVTVFYDAALSNQPIMDGLAQFNITTTDLTDVQAKLATLDAAEAIQKTEIGEAQQATLDRDTALDALDDWMSSFQEVARIALEDNPQLLESLGINIKR